MRKDIHPNYSALKVRIGNDTFETMSTYKGVELLMDIDFRKHPAWTMKGFSEVNVGSKNVSTFNKKFAGLPF